jgi:hypothetical protein
VSVLLDLIISALAENGVLYDLAGDGAEYEYGPKHEDSLQAPERNEMHFFDIPISLGFCLLLVFSNTGVVVVGLH